MVADTFGGRNFVILNNTNIIKEMRTEMQCAVLKIKLLSTQQDGTI